MVKRVLLTFDSLSTEPVASLLSKASPNVWDPKEHTGKSANQNEQPPR